MDNIRFQYQGKIISVWLDDKLTGHIKKVDGGYQYFVWRSNAVGDVFKTKGEVIASLRSE